MQGSVTGVRDLIPPLSCIDVASERAQSFGVLIYYAIANASALTQPPDERRWPRWLNILGLIGCLALAAALPVGSVVAGLLMFAVGLLGRLVVQQKRRRSAGA